MAVPWLDDDQTAVAGVLEQHPFAGGRCADAARAILPVAARVDPDAEARKLEPISPARYVLPVGPPPRRPFRHHVTVAVALHQVDALTGACGTPDAEYLFRFWQHPDALAWAPVGPEDWELL